ncbi:MAG: hypothetical protein KAT71_04995, partial [Gammaproteobacteria bacterium]|nr:hypothetical protein [Gammaproteobacteria bacterium]
NKVLFSSAHQLMRTSRELVLLRFTNYLRPLREQTEISAKLIAGKIINPKNTPVFDYYLLSLLHDYPQITNAYVGDKNGNFFEVSRVGKGMFLNRRIYQTQKPRYEITQYLDKNGKVVQTSKNMVVTYDPRVRPWYKTAKEQKSAVWSDIYSFKTPPELGLTAATPIYNRAGDLQAVFGIDVTLSSFASFITNLKISDNSFVFIMDDQGSLIREKYGSSGLNNIKNLELLWAKASFTEYQKHKQELFNYKYKGKHYLAAYQEIPATGSDKWYLGIIVPAADVIGSLQHDLLRALLFACLILLLGLSIIYLFLRRIANHIVRLASEAHKITQLNFINVEHKKIYITELLHIEQAFAGMRSALKSFARYVPYNLVKKLIDKGLVAHVGGKNTQITTMFSDIHDFTALSEPMQPGMLTEFLSEYFVAMTDVVHKYQGTLDKYIGDGIMAFWGAPEEDAAHAEHACECALKSLVELEKLNASWQKEGKPKLTIRIGINSGEAIVGNVGSYDRLSYTAMGDSVNLASRLETLNKSYNTAIIVSENTYELV